MISRLFLPALMAAACGFSSVPARAADGSACSMDYEFFQGNPTFALGVVQGDGGAHFYKDGGGCPGLNAKCQVRATVMPGDRLVLGRGKGEFVCAMFPGGKGGAIGWIERSRIRPLAVPAQPPLTAWTGRWSAVSSNASISFAAPTGTLNANGNISWTPPDHGAPARGAFNAGVNRSGNSGQLIDGKCAVRFTILADLLLASSSDACSEMPVSFTGLYRRPVETVQPAVARPIVKPVKPHAAIPAKGRERTAVHKPVRH